MNKLHEFLGLTDGIGSVSSQRVFSFLIIASWLLTKAVASMKSGTPMTFDNTEVGLVASVLGAGVLKNVAENINIGGANPPPPATPPTP